MFPDAGDSIPYAESAMPVLRAARPDELQQLLDIDNETGELFAQAGLRIELADDHPFVVAEAARWARAIDRGHAHVAVDTQDRPVGFTTVGFVDGHPYLDQLSVRPSAMRRGIGTALLRHAIAWSTGHDLWLTTYSHLPWNGPYYRRRGFVPVPEPACGAEIRAILEEQRTVLPDPDKRIAMVHPGPASAAPTAPR